MGENNNFSKFAIPEDVKNVFKEITDNQVEINLPELKLPDFNYNSLYKAAENIGKWGWTVPFSFTLSLLGYFEKDNLTKEDIDTFFKVYYSEEDNFDRLINQIVSIQDIQQWHTAIKQCVYAHKKHVHPIYKHTDTYIRGNAINF